MKAFITFEGVDGSGKTTQFKLIEKYLKEKNTNFISVREPGGTAIGEKIRSIILDPKNTEICDITEMLLYAASRSQLMSEVILPSLNQDKIVLCDRFIDSSFVYQSFARGIDFDIVNSINMTAINNTLPNKTFVMDINPEVTLKRRYFSSLDRIEKENLEFHMKVYTGYKKLAQLFPERVVLIDANRPINQIFEDIIGKIQNFIC